MCLVVWSGGWKEEGDNECYEVGGGTFVWMFVRLFSFFFGA